MPRKTSPRYSGAARAAQHASCAEPAQKVDGSATPSQRICQPGWWPTRCTPPCKPTRWRPSRSACSRRSTSSSPLRLCCAESAYPGRARPGAGLLFGRTASGGKRDRLADTKSHAALSSRHTQPRRTGHPRRLTTGGGRLRDLAPRTRIAGHRVADRAGQGRARNWASVHGNSAAFRSRTHQLRCAAPCRIDARNGLHAGQRDCRAPGEWEVA